MSEPFIAEVRIFAGNFAPRSWAFCDGQLLPVAQNTALFSLIGSTYGGDGRTTTGLPDLQGRAPMHPGRGPGLTSRRLGQKLGTETVTLSELQIPSHSHTLRVHAGGSIPVGPSVTASLANSRTINAWQTNTTANLVTMAPETLSNTGGGQSHTNVQPYLTLNFIIALQGLYPSRS
ncbi:MAG: microcystin-dependent protein [Arenicella sp.]|jgi:microcystin-dependent protein